MHRARGMSDDPRHRLGRIGEELACTELRRRGYEIVARRYRTRAGEIDIVARHDEWTVFVEVKTRDGERFGDGAEAVTGWKQRRLMRMAADYATRHGLMDTPLRFDVVAVDVSTTPPRLEVYSHAFEALS